jgi:hypothetical protein
MTSATKIERRHLELAFESSVAILKLEGFSDSEESKELQQRVILGELSCEEAVQVVLQRAKTLPLLNATVESH